MKKIKFGLAIDFTFISSLDSTLERVGVALTEHIQEKQKSNIDIIIDSIEIGKQQDSSTFAIKGWEIERKERPIV